MQINVDKTSFDKHLNCDKRKVKNKLPTLYLIIIKTYQIKASYRQKHELKEL